MLQHPADVLLWTLDPCPPSGRVAACCNQEEAASYQEGGTSTPAECAARSGRVPGARLSDSIAGARSSSEATAADRGEEPSSREDSSEPALAERYRSQLGGRPIVIIGDSIAKELGAHLKGTGGFGEDEVLVVAKAGAVPKEIASHLGKWIAADQARRARERHPRRGASPRHTLTRARRSR